MEQRIPICSELALAQRRPIIRSFHSYPAKNTHPKGPLELTDFDKSFKY